MQDGNRKHMLVSEKAPSAEGGYRETNIAGRTYSDAHKGLCENIPKEGDVGHVIYFCLSGVSLQTQLSVRGGGGGVAGLHGI